MWQSFRRQMSTIRGIICDLAPLVKHAYPVLGLTSPLPSAAIVRPVIASSSSSSSFVYATSRRGLSTSSVESVKIDTTTAAPSAASNAAQTFRLVTGCYGISKDIFYGKSSNIASSDKNGSKTTYGDDSWFVTSHKNVDVMGVADGVGGWREMGIDPSKFSSSLMQQCKRIVEHDLMNSATLKNMPTSTSTSTASRAQQVGERTPIDILVESYQSLRESKDPNLIGSSTACIVVFNRESRLVHTANLGDSGFVIVRDNKIVHRSQEQCHYFNAPFQLAIVPTRPGGSSQHADMSSFSDSPESAASSTFELVEGDFIVLGTDGLWDNLSEGLLLLKISKIQSYLLEDLQKAAHELVNFTAELAQDPDYLSPFAISARKNGINFRGGKPDDITVLLARVTKS